MDVIEVGRVLVAEEQAHVAVRIVASRRLHLGLQHEVADLDVLQPRDVDRATVRRLVLALLEQAVRLAYAGVDDLPRLPIGRLPAVRALLEIVTEDQRQVPWLRVSRNDAQRKPTDATEHDDEPSAHD